MDYSEYRRPLRPVDAVAETIRRSILDGKLEPGAFLPPERALAEELAVSRLTLRAALSKLEAEGLVQPKQGEGVLVLPITSSANLSILPHLLGARGALDRSLLRSFLELRRAIAVEALALAASRIKRRALRKLEALIALQMKEDDEALYIERDLEIARAVLEASENLAMLLLLNSIESAYRSRPELMRALVADRRRSLAGYQLVLHILRTRDSAMARRELRPALEALDEPVMRRLLRSESLRNKSARKGPR